MRIIWPLAALAIACSQAGAEGIDPLIRRYNECVLTVSLGIPGERNMAAEQSFFACQTEEQAIRAYFALVNTPPATTEAAIASRKLALKRTILRDPH